MKRTITEQAALRAIERTVEALKVLNERVDQLEKERDGLYKKLNEIQSRLLRIEEQRPSLDISLGRTKGLYESVFGEEMGNGLYESIFGDSKGVNG